MSDNDIGKGESSDSPKLAEQLLPLVYEELRRLAAHKLAGEVPGHTLQATALVHEAWMRFARDPQHQWNDREHFFRTAAEAMRRVLVDRARERRTMKRGADVSVTQFSESNMVAPSGDDELLAVHDALDQLAQRDALSAELIKLRYFAGLSMSEAAAALGLSVRSAERMWAFAKAWLRRALSP